MCRITEGLKFQVSFCHLELIPTQTASSGIKNILDSKKVAVTPSVAQSLKFSYCITDIKRRYSITPNSICGEGWGEKNDIGCSVFFDDDWWSGGSKLFRN